MEMIASPPGRKPPGRAPGNPRMALPPEQWPAADRLAWDRAQKPGNPLNRPGAASTWRPATRKSVAGAYGRWLAFLAARGALDLQAEVGQPAAHHITAARMYDYVEHLLTSCSTGTAANYLALLVMMGQALAPKTDWQWLQELQKQLQCGALPVRDKRRRIVPSGELLRLGLELMATAQARTAAAGISRHTAQDFRDGLMIALLASRPLRQKNFVAMEIGQHLLPMGEGYRISFAAHETKTRRALDFAFPDRLLPALRQYLKIYRPFLLALRATRGQSRSALLPLAGNALWVTQYGTRFGANAQTKALKKHTVARFDKFVNPHLFRDCVASSIANEDPEHVRITAQILGHERLDTTEKYYIQAQSSVATQRYHDRILSIRADGKKRDRHDKAGRQADQ